MSGAQSPWLRTMTGMYLGIEVDPERIKKRLRTGYCDHMVNSLDEALRIIRKLSARKSTSRWAGWQLRRHIPELAERGGVPDILTDQHLSSRSANGYVPSGMSLEERAGAAQSAIPRIHRRSLDTMARHVEAMLKAPEDGFVTFDTQQNIPHLRFEHGVKNAYDVPDSCRKIHSSAFLRRRGPFRWAALSGAIRRLHTTDDLVLADVSAATKFLAAGSTCAQRIKFQGLPCRICWLAMASAQSWACPHDLVKKGSSSAIVMGRDHLDCGRRIALRETSR